MKKYLLATTLLAMAICGGCEGETDGFAINGYIQKGPFITDTSVEIKELDNSLISTGKSFSTLINNNFGGFDITCNSQQSYAELVANGYYFDEVEGELSEGPLTLRAISRMDQASNINILTTLQANRMRRLITDGVAYNDALAQSKHEVLKIFNIDESEVANFNNMNIVQRGASNSILLAISSILQNGRSVGEMSDLISRLGSDIADNGVVDDSSLTEKIRESSQNINVAQIIRNLESRYHELGESVTIDNFYDFVDSDGDGELNGGEPYLFVDDNYMECDYTACEQSIYFTSNYTPRVNITGDFAQIVAIEDRRVVLKLAENAGQQSRTAEVQLMSSDGRVVERVTIDQASSFSELLFNMSFGASRTRTTLSDVNIEIDRVTMIAFDADGNLIFNNNDDSPTLNGYSYAIYTKLAKSLYEGCTLYTIVNGSDDYSRISNMRDAEQMKSSATRLGLLAAKNEGVGFSDGRPRDDELGLSMNFAPIDVRLQYAGVAKVDFEISYGDSIAEADCEIATFILNGNIYTATYIFNNSTEGLSTSGNYPINVEDLSCVYIGGGSTIDKISITLKSGANYTVELSRSIVIESSKAYKYTLMIKTPDITTSETIVDAWGSGSPISLSTSTATTR